MQKCYWTANDIEKDKLIVPSLTIIDKSRLSFVSNQRSYNGKQINKNKESKMTKYDIIHKLFKGLNENISKLQQ